MSLEAAMRDARVCVDARGLMPREQAIEILSASTTVERGSLDSIWAALLSLEPSELVSATQHLDWRFPVRGRENVALVSRYGKDALPWIRTRIREGVLVNHPWCVVPCVLELDAPEALELLLEVDGLVADGGDMKFWQFTPSQAEVGAETLEAAATDAVLEWARRHPGVALPVLAARAESNARARKAIVRLAEKQPEDIRRALEALGASALVDSLGLPRELTVDAILRVLDGACSGQNGFWPWFSMGVDGRYEYFGLRLVVFRAKAGDGWGIVLERLMGCDPDSFQVSRYAYGPGATSGADFDEIVFLESAFEIEGPEESVVFHGNIAKGPMGDLVLDESLFATHDLAPGRATEFGGWAARTLAVRAYLAENPRAFWPEPAEALSASGVPDGELFLTSDAFFHVSGPAPEGRKTEPWSLLPSQSTTYRSLAEAIVSRVASRFVPGESNLDYRLHAYEADEYVLPWRQHRAPVADGYLAAAMKEAAVPLDARGLLPLERAREILRSQKALARGKGRRADDSTWVWDLDLTWAALLSLDTADEAAAVLRELEIIDSPRDAEANRALVERYGDEALKVVAAKTDAAGILQGSSPFLRATVLGVGSPEGFRFVWDIGGFQEPSSDATPDAQATALFTAWMMAYPEIGYVELARLAEKGDAAAASFLKSWATPQVRRVHRWLEAGLGAERAKAAIAQAGLTCDLVPEQITAVLDAAIPAGHWPVFRTETGPSRELHGMRLSAARARGKADWIVVLERLEGYGQSLKIDRYLLGENVSAGPNDAAASSYRVALSWDRIPETANPDPLDERLVEPPDYWTKIDGAPAQVAKIRAALREAPELFWPAPEPLLEALGFTDRTVTIVTTSFAHVAGSDDGLPSAAPAYVSLAKALVAEKAALFEPGTNTVDPRLHARDATEEEDNPEGGEDDATEEDAQEDDEA